MEKSISSFLINHGKKDTVSFHMPGHKGMRLFESLGYEAMLNNVADFDITEIAEADNLFQAETIIRETMDKYKKMYGSHETYLLVNGSSSGLIASIMSCVGKDDKIIVARNCHKSIYAGIEMAGAEPVYVKPELIDGMDITGEVRGQEIENALVQNKDVKAVILPSPNYYGICSDIEAIARICHENNVVLIVDQAHGAHLKQFEVFCNNSNLPKSAESQGADIVINSTHKTLCSFTQSAILNIMSPNIDLGNVGMNLQRMESTSPSYLLMGSLDLNADIISTHGDNLFKEWIDNLNYFYEEASSIHGIEVMNHPMLDFSKINIKANKLGYDGHALERYLMDCGIYPELISGDMVMCMTGVGNDRSDFDRLLKSLRNLEVSEVTGSVSCEGERKKEKSLAEILRLKIEKVDVPKHKKLIKLENATGEVCASAIVPYPPGIPVICPGERFDKELVDYLVTAIRHGEKIIGINKAGYVLVGR